MLLVSDCVSIVLLRVDLSDKVLRGSDQYIWSALFKVKRVIIISVWSELLKCCFYDFKVSVLFKLTLVSIFTDQLNIL